MLSYLSIFYVIFLSLAKVIYFFDIRKQFITFLIEMITNSYNLMDFLLKNVNPVQEFGEKASF